MMMIVMTIKNLSGSLRIQKPKQSKHLKGHLVPHVSDVTFLDQRVIPGSL